MARKVGPTGKKGTSGSVPEQQDDTSKKVAKGKNAFGFETQAETLIKWFQGKAENHDALYQVVDILPYPIEIFAPDGTTVYTNRASLDMVNCKDPTLLIGKYNLLKDPVCMDKLGYRKEIERAFKGETVVVKDFPAPIQDVFERGVIKDKPWEKATMDLFFYPIWQNDKLHFVICVFVVKTLYFGRPEIARAREYIDTHWQDAYDAHKVAGSVSISDRQLYNLFKQYTQTTPGEYYKIRKVEHIKEKLADKNLTIKEVFVSCGEDSHGWFAKVFKEVTGMSPREYRNKLEGASGKG